VRRLWLRWAGLVAFAVVLGVLFINLGEWQLDRLEQRRARNAATVTNEQRPVRPLAEVFTRPLTDADQWQRVEAVGTFVADQQFLVRYRSNGGDKGYEVVTPLRTSAGVVLVDRGFVATEPGVGIPATVPPPPAGEVRVVGHVRRNEEGRRSAVTPVNGQLRLINSDAIGAALGYPLLNGYIGLLQVTPPQSGDFVPIELPEINEGPHFWYALQWFSFTGIALAGIVVFIRADLRARREQQAASRSAGAGAGDTRT
jgi:cytochrome oxidase assembly protein ShyY1